MESSAEKHHSVGSSILECCCTKGHLEYVRELVQTPSLWQPPVLSLRCFSVIPSLLAESCLFPAWLRLVECGALSILSTPKPVLDDKLQPMGHSGCQFWCLEHRRLKALLFISNQKKTELQNSKELQNKNISHRPRGTVKCARSPPELNLARTCLFCLLWYFKGSLTHLGHSQGRSELCLPWLRIQLCSGVGRRLMVESTACNKQRKLTGLNWAHWHFLQDQCVSQWKP